MELWFAIKTLHIISATVLFGTGMGIAFFMFRSQYGASLQERWFAARTTVLADWCFTLPAVIIQPVTGFWLAIEGGHAFDDAWLMWSLLLYGLAGACWLPVVWLQKQMKDMIAIAMEGSGTLPDLYHRYFRIWFVLGWPAFGALVIVFWLMVTRPL